MSYSSMTVAYAVKRLNVTYFLPAIQREFVWDSTRIVSLFDSIMKGYPISSFLFWQLEYANRDRWGIYKFIENVKRGFTHNELANLDGVREPILVIDGQQRLTSFLVGLKGTNAVRVRYGRINDQASWPKYRLYLDLLKDPSVEENDNLVSPSFGFQFFSVQPTNSEGQYWFKVGQILDFDTEARFLSFKQMIRDELGSDLTKEQRILIEGNLDLLYSSIWRNEVINYYLETNQEYDRALDIFVRANERGEPLSTSDLLLSIMTSKWQRVNARDEVNNFVDYLNSSLTHVNSLNKDFIMKNCLVLADLPVTYKVQNYTEKNLLLMESNWPRVKDAIERCVKSVNSFGIDGNNLTAKNALIPIIYYLYLNPAVTMLTGKTDDVRNATLIRRWLLAALLNNVFGGSSDSLLSNLRAVLKEVGQDTAFPIVRINAKVSESGRRSKFDDNAVDRFLDTRYGGSGKETFLALSILYDDNNWGDKPVHQDHIFPRQMFEYLAMQQAGFDDAAWQRYYSLEHKVGNLELLLPHENQEKSDRPFVEWITTRDPSFQQRHLIPNEPGLWRFDRFEGFIEKREELIHNRLTLLFGPPDIKEA